MRRCDHSEEQTQTVNSAKLNPIVMIVINNPVTAFQAAESSSRCSRRTFSLKFAFQTA
jgi:hypothetical protein